MRTTHNLYQKGQQDSSKIVYEMLSFQYKPLEKRLLRRLTPSMQDKYLSSSYITKIKVLDKFAAELGL